MRRQWLLRSNEQLQLLLGNPYDVLEKALKKQTEQLGRVVELEEILVMAPNDMARVSRGDWRRKHRAYRLTPIEKKSIEKKHRSWQQYMETNDKSKYAEFARARNKVKALSKRAQKEPQRNIYGNLKDSPKLIKERIPVLERLDGSCIHRHRENRQAV